MDNRESEQLIEQIYGVFNSHDLSTLDQYMNPDYEDYSAGTPFPVPFDLLTLKGLLQMYLTAFPDAHWTISDFVANGVEDGSRAAWREHFTGTHTGEFMGIPPTGQKVAIEGISLGEIRGGKASRHWSVYDNLGLLQQLGVIPTMGQEPAAAAR